MRRPVAADPNPECPSEKVIVVTATCDIERSILADTSTGVVRGEMPRDELPAWLWGVFATVRDYLHGIGVARTGPPFARYTVRRDTVAVEAGYPVARTRSRRARTTAAAGRPSGR